jgi:hypothetical protein
MTPEKQRIAQAAQLLRLRELRQQQALAAQARARQEQLQAQEAVRRAETAMQAQRDAQVRLLAAMQDGAALPRVLDFAEMQRVRVADLLERAEYALIDDQEALHSADRRLDQASLALRQAQGREQAATDLLKRERLQLRRADERRAEREDAPRPRSCADTHHNPSRATP